MLQIETGKQIKQIQAAFNAHYPYLKIEMMKQHGGKAEAMRENEVLAKVPATTISVGKQQTVARLEQDFLEKTGLKVKVYRRFCNVWIETTLTNDWTLEQQNTEGKLLSDLNTTIA
jgi:hypothetical protein